MAEFMYQEVSKVTKATMRVVYYVAFNCDEVSTMNNQSWLSVHCYVMKLSKDSDLDFFRLSCLKIGE
jgi:hypothetical protein